MDDVHYIMTMYFGGQGNPCSAFDPIPAAHQPFPPANQALAMINVLFIAKYTGRVAVL